MSSTFPNGKTRQDTLECLLAEPNGRWLGDGLGGLKTVSIRYESVSASKHLGPIGLNWLMLCEEDPIGISDIGISICEN